MELPENDLDFLDNVSASVERNPIFEQAMGNLRKLAAAGDEKAKDSLQIATLALEVESNYVAERQAMFNLAVTTFQLLLPEICQKSEADAWFLSQMAQVLHVICYDAFCRGWRARGKEGKDDA